MKDKKLEERLERLEELLQQIGGEIFEIKSKQGRLDRDYCDLLKDMENIEIPIQKRKELIEWVYRENKQKRFRGKK